SDIQLMSMHGSMLGDQARVARVLQFPIAEFNRTPAEAQAEAADIASAVNSGLFSHGDNPLFTLNAFAFSAEGDPDPLVQGLPDKLIFGDGIVDALTALGIGDVGPARGARWGGGGRWPAGGSAPGPPPPWALGGPFSPPPPPPRGAPPPHRAD